MTDKMIDRKPFADNPLRVERRRLLQGALTASIGMLLPNASAHAASVDVAAHSEQSPAPNPSADTRVFVNQAGYLPDEPKRAVVAADRPAHKNLFAIVDDDITPQVRFRGQLKPFTSADQKPYGEVAHHFHADFDEFDRPGRYRIRLADGRLSMPFNIGADVYKKLAPLVLRYFDLQRCGPQCSEHRNICHIDDGLIDGGPRHGQAFDGAGGWHDAGDYLKFVETTSYVTALILYMCDRREVASPSLEPDDIQKALLRQGRFGVEWLLKMHPKPDEFYYQIGSDEDHDRWRLPEEDNGLHSEEWKPRTVHYGVGANLAGRCAASFAMAARLFSRSDPNFASRCKAAAESVFVLGQENPHPLTTKPDSYYPETTWADDMEWGAVEIYRATGIPYYLKQATKYAHQAGAAKAETSIYNTHALAHATLYLYAADEDKARLLEYLRADADLVRSRAENPYGLATPYIWGTAEAAAGAALTLLLFAEVANEPAYREIARRQRDFILGCNPFGVSYVIGAGTRYPQFPHHQIANITGVELSGAVVGGPTARDIFHKEKINLKEPGMDRMEVGPATPEDPEEAIAVYHDAVQDYVCNEPANDYSAKFLTLLSFYGV